MDNRNIKITKESSKLSHTQINILKDLELIYAIYPIDGNCDIAVSPKGHMYFSNKKDALTDKLMWRVCVPVVLSIVTAIITTLITLYLKKYF